MIAPCGARGCKSLACSGRTFLWFLVRKMDIIVQEDSTAPSLVEQRKRGSIAVSKRSKEGKECFSYNALGLSFRIASCVSAS